jgi:hypothetical protein
LFFFPTVSITEDRLRNTPFPLIGSWPKRAKFFSSPDYFASISILCNTENLGTQPKGHDSSILYCLGLTNYTWVTENDNSVAMYCSSVLQFPEGTAVAVTQPSERLQEKEVSETTLKLVVLWGCSG